MEIGKKYKMRLELNGKELVYTGIITEIDDIFITFKDKFGSIITYNKKFFMYFEEVSE